MLAMRFVVLLPLVLAGPGLAHAEALPRSANPVPVAQVEGARDLSAENCTDKEFKERARNGQLVLNARSGHGDEYDRLYRDCVQEVQRPGP